MQLKRDPPLFFILHSQKLSGESTQPILSLFELKGPFLGATLQLLLEPLVVRHLSIKRSRFLLQSGDGAKALIVVAQCGITLIRNHGRVIRANLQKQLCMLGAIEEIGRINAGKREVLLLGQLVPK